jgi:hypothetical protein
MKSIGLCMIVKNEAHVISRCLDSVRPLIDYVLIVDTGSSDNTQGVVRDYLAKHGIPGDVIDEPWKDFAYNRSFSLARLRERTQIDYAFVMDADDTLVLDDGVDVAKFKANLDKDFYHVGIDHGPIWYHRPLLLNNRLPFYFKGVLHEFVVAPQVPVGLKPGVVTNMRVHYGADGARSRNPKKMLEDALTLEKALADESEEFMRSRYTFYLAESWLGAGEKEKALEMFLKRAELPGHAEASVSLFTAAMIKQELGHPDVEIIGMFLRAFEADPRRAEPLYGAMRYCRLANKPHQGYLIGKHGLTLPEPGFGTLFVHSYVYDFALLEEFAVVAYQSGHFEECLQALNKLLGAEKLPKEARSRVKSNADIVRGNIAKIASAQKPGLPDMTFVPQVHAAPMHGPSW